MGAAVGPAALAVPWIAQIGSPILREALIGALSGGLSGGAAQIAANARQRKAGVWGRSPQEHPLPSLQPR